MPYQFVERVWTTPHNMDHWYVHLFQVLFTFSSQPDATFRDSKSSFSSTVSILLCKLDNSELFRHSVARVVQYTQTATIRQRQLANRSTGSRFAVNASRYTGNLINHLSLDGNAHRKSVYKTRRKCFANVKDCWKCCRFDSNRTPSSQFKSTRLTSSRFERH